MLHITVVDNNTCKIVSFINKNIPDNKQKCSIATQVFLIIKNPKFFRMITKKLSASMITKLKINRTNIYQRYEK
ncbi:MAG: hypothetical protein JST62_09515 [Bacteroidetes bacterium]|nr:hypothetical protein [Bacteroidota bacterium]